MIPKAENRVGVLPGHHHDASAAGAIAELQHHRAAARDFQVFEDGTCGCWDQPVGRTGDADDDSIRSGWDVIFGSNGRGSITYMYIYIYIHIRVYITKTNTWAYVFLAQKDVICFFKHIGFKSEDTGYSFGGGHETCGCGWAVARFLQDREVVSVH